MDRERYLSLFLSEVRRLLDEVEARLGETEKLNTEARDLLRRLHTLKGMAATMTVPSMVLVAHAAEELCERLASGQLAPSDELLALLGEAVDRLRMQADAVGEGRDPPDGEGYDSRVREFVRMGATYAFQLVRTPEDESGAPSVRATDRSLLDAQAAIAEALSAARRLKQLVPAAALPEVERIDAAVRHLYDQLVIARTGPFGTVVPGLRRHVRGVAFRHGKAVSLSVTGEEVEVDSSVMGRVLGPLTVLLSNAVVHGIEDTAGRAAAGKPRVGRVGVHAERVGRTLVLRVEDDGAGFDVVALGKDGADPLAAAFSPGVSTRKTTDEDAGRGIGLDAVRHGVDGLGGTLSVESSPNRGTRVRIVVPVLADLVALHVVRLGEHVLGLRSQGVEGIGPADQAEEPAPALLGLGAPRGAALRLADGRSAAIDEVLEEGEFLVSAPPFPLNRFPWIRGTSVAPDGRILLVVEP